MNKAANNKIFLYLIIAFVFIAFVFAMSTDSVFGYFSSSNIVPTKIVMDVELFDHLDSPTNPSAPWGTEGNPYVINQNRHLRNLFMLQNSRDITAINEYSVFQVSTTAGYPCFVGGASNQNLFEIPSIGSEDFPFIATFTGVTTTNPSRYVTLPNGKISDTSVIGNIKVLAYEGQIDIGLFGNVGRADPNDTTGEAEEITTTGYIGNLLLSDIQISSDTTGDITKEAHEHYFISNHDKETNHLGILAGHVEYAVIENISVFYTQTLIAGKTTSVVKAFDIIANEEDTKYTTAGGILGYYKQIMIGSQAELPVNSEGVDRIGGLFSGFDLGIVYSQDIWEYMEIIMGSPMDEDSYDLQDTQELNDLYANTVMLDGLPKTYFRIGVFTFVHSRQGMGTDRIAKLWGSEYSNEWDVSSTGSYQNPTTEILYDNAKKYTTNKLNASDFTTVYVKDSRGRDTTTVDYYYIKDNPYAGNNYNNYRFMIVYEDPTTNLQYALVKYGETASVQKIDTSNFIIPEDQLVYYTFRVSNNRGNNSPNYNNHSPTGTTPDGLNTYKYAPSSRLIIDPSTTTGAGTQFLLYGKETLNPSGIAVEEERPLRIYDTFSYMYSSTDAWETIRLVHRNATSGGGIEFRLQRTTDTKDHGYYLRFTVGDGYVNTAQNQPSQATYVRLYAVNVNPVSSGGSTDFNYEKEIYNPTTASKVTYDMSQNVLFYDGTYNSSNDALKYRYKMTPLEDLNWPNNEDIAITEIDNALFMGDPSSSYYISGDAIYPYYGVLKNIPLGGGKVLYAPRASIAFTINGTGIRNDTAKINVIVATNPYQLIDQKIEVSYFTTNANGVPSSSRTVRDAFVLPPVSGVPVGAGMTSRTTPIQVSYNGGATYRTAYPNMNRLLVAYTITVPSQNTQSFFLEASKGSATFVYLSVERVASQLSNPTHKNDVFFAALNSVDFVYDVTSGTSTKIATVTSQEYIKSLITVYFGLKVDPASVPEGDQLILMNAKDFEYNIVRVRESLPGNMYSNKLYIYANTGTPLGTYKEIILDYINFNFYDSTYYDIEADIRVYSDIVVLYINGEEVIWKTIYAPS